MLDLARLLLLVGGINDFLLTVELLLPVAVVFTGGCCNIDVGRFLGACEVGVVGVVGEVAVDTMDFLRWSVLSCGDSTSPAVDFLLCGVAVYGVIVFLF